jgi:chromosome segregation ATPase
MDPFNLESWKHQWDVFTSAPYVILPALAIGWGIGQKFAGAKIKSLNGTITNLNSQIAVLEARLEQAKEHLEYVKDREEDVRRAYAELEKGHDELKAQIAANAPKETLVATAEKLDGAITQASTANNSLAVALTAMDFTTWRPEFGRPQLGITARSD